MKLEKGHPLYEVAKSKAAEVIYREAVDRLSKDYRNAKSKADKEAMIARARAIAEAEVPDNSTGTNRPTDSNAAPVEAIETLREKEDCEFCLKLLDVLETFPPDQRLIGVAEYGEFRRALDESDEAAEEVLSESDVLIDAVHDLQDLPAPQ